MEFSFTEENYLKAIYKLSLTTKKAVSTNAIANELQTTAASVSDMLKKLANKRTINYRKYQGVKLTDLGEKTALSVIRKHRLWETFLVDKLHFNWDEVHEIAEELEHIQSARLIEKLDEFLGRPTQDPHGDPIPTPDGELIKEQKVLLNSMSIKDSGVVIGLNNSEDSLLRHLNKLGIAIGTKIAIIDKIDFDDSIEIMLDGKNEVNISKMVADNIFVSVQN